MSTRRQCWRRSKQRLRVLRPRRRLHDDQRADHRIQERQGTAGDAAKYLREVQQEQDQANGVSRIVRAQIGSV